MLQGLVSASLSAAPIFVRRDAVRRLTTAAGGWITAAIGMAAGAGLPLLAALATGIYLVVALVFPALTRFLPRSGTAISAVRVRYPDGRASCARRCRPRPRAASRWTSCR